MCVMLSCTCCLRICNSSILLSADGAADGVLVHVTLGIHPMINENGVSFVVTFGHAFVMIWTLRVMGLVPPQYVFLSRPVSCVPLVPLCLYIAPSCLIYDNTLLDPFQQCLSVSCLVYGSLPCLSI